MLVKQEQINPCEVELEIEVEAEKVSSTIDQTYHELGKSASVPGFRKGKAPRAVLESFLDKDRVWDRVADKLMEEAYGDALDETKLDPFRPAGVQVVKLEAGEPMLFKARVPLAPKVEVGEYIGLEVERKAPPVSDEDVEEEIKRIIEDRTEMTQVTDRELREGDTAVVDLTDESEPDKGPNRNVVKVGDNLSDFDKGLIGMRIDEEKVIPVTYAEDFSDDNLRGKTISIPTKLIEIHTKELPELTDDWVKETFAPEPKEGEEPLADPIDTVEKLRARVKGAMERSAQSYADSAVRDEVVSKVIEGSTVHFPEVMVEEHVERRLAELQDSLKQRQVTLDDYLKYRNETLERVHDRYAEETRNILAMSLVFREIIEKESIQVEKEDLDAMIREMAEERGVPVESMRAYMDSTDSKDLVENRVARKKVVDFLVHASNIKNVGA